MRWYVLRSKPNKEEALWREVDARGIEAFYPCLKTKPVNPRSRRRRPYFPGYLFVQASLAEVGPGAFAWLPHSQGLVSFDGEPAPVPPELVEAIRRKVSDANAAGPSQVADFDAGEAVVIGGGAFEGYKAIFDTRLAGLDRVRVLVKLLEAQAIKVELPAGLIQRIRPN